MRAVYVLAVLSLALFAGAAAAAAEDDKATVDQLCSLDKKAPLVTSISEVKSLIGELKNGVDCPAGVKDAILALEPVVELRSVCSAEAADVIVSFYNQYVDKNSKVKRNLPKQLKKFFISYGLQVSKLCKQTMVQELEKVSTDKGITEQDLQLVTKAIRESENVEKIFGKSPKLEDLVIIIRTDSSKGEQKKKINMPPKQKKYFELFQERCVNKFRPVYESLVSPIVRLASIGLNYKDESTKEAMESFRQSSTFDEWFNVIVACEPVANYEAVLIPAEKLDQFGNKATMTVLDDEDIAELREKTGLTLDESEIVQPVDYKVDTQLDDLVLNKEDKHLTSSIQWFGKGLREINKMRVKLIKRTPTILRTMMKNGGLQFGLHPNRAMESAKKLAKYGMSRQSAAALAVLAIGWTMAGIAAGLMATAIIFCPHLLPLWAILGGLIIAILFVGTILVSTCVPDNI